MNNVSKAIDIHCSYMDNEIPYKAIHNSKRVVNTMHIKSLEPLIACLTGLNACL